MAIRIRRRRLSRAGLAATLLFSLAACSTTAQQPRKTQDSPGSSGTGASANGAGGGSGRVETSSAADASASSGGTAAPQTGSNGKAGAGEVAGSNSAAGAPNGPGGPTGSGGSGNGTGSAGAKQPGGSAGSGPAGGAAGGSKNAGGSSGAAGRTSTPVDAGSPSPTSACGSSTPPDGLGTVADYTIDVSGTSREYMVWVPSDYKSDKPYRLVFTWHGLGGTAQQIACGYGTGTCRPWFYGVQPLAENSAIFVAGQGLDSGGTGGGVSGTGWPNTNGQDVAFVRALVDWMKSHYCIDQSRIFSVGMSYGGMMSNTLGCEMGDVFRAIAPASGAGPGGFGPAKPNCVGQVGAWIAHGTQDDTVAFDSGLASRDYWLSRNHCGTSTTPAAVAPCIDYQGCDPQYPVTWCAFDGGHTVPSFEAQATWNFLKQF